MKLFSLYGWVAVISTKPIDFVSTKYLTFTPSPPPTPPKKKNLFIAFTIFNKQLGMMEK